MAAGKKRQPNSQDDKKRAPSGARPSDEGSFGAAPPADAASDARSGESAGDGDKIGVFAEMWNPVNEAIVMVQDEKGQFTIGRVLDYVIKNQDNDTVEQWVKRSGTCCIACLVTEFLEKNHSESKPGEGLN